MDPDAKWVFIADNLNTHQSEGLVKLVAEQLELHSNSRPRHGADVLWFEKGV
jgi:hypothetical protein